MLKDKHIISGINVFFHKNDCNKAINSIMTTIRHLNLRSSYIGIEKRPNCKLTCLQVLELLLISRSSWSRTLSNIIIRDFRNYSPAKRICSIVSWNRITLTG